MATTGDAFPIVGGGQQLDQLLAQLQQEYIRLRMREIEQPQLWLDEKSRALAGLQGLSAATGYVQPSLWNNIIGSMYGQGARGGSPYIMPPAPPPNPEQQKYKIGTEGNVVKTLAQLRQELVAAGGDQKWTTASVEEVLAEYAKVTGYPATPFNESASTPPAQPSQPAETQPETPATQQAKTSYSPYVSGGQAAEQSGQRSPKQDWRNSLFPNEPGIPPRPPRYTTSPGEFPDVRPEGPFRVRINDSGMPRPAASPWTLTGYEEEESPDDLWNRIRKATASASGWR